jgi:hypothetical protein
MAPFNEFLARRRSMTHGSMASGITWRGFPVFFAAT